jgi:hypothetical protein
MYLLPRLKASLQRRRGAPDDVPLPLPRSNADFLEDASFVSIQDYRIYPHPILRLRYTTYDARRDEDLIRAQSCKNNVMVLQWNGDVNQQSHPFQYARVLGIFHANATLVGYAMDAQRFDFLWVRWYNLQEEGSDTLGPLGLPCLAFPPVTDRAAFGFLDPADVLRASHIIPRFALGRSVDENGISLNAKDGEDYVSYVVNRLVVSLLFIIGCQCVSDDLRNQISRPRHGDEIPLGSRCRSRLFSSSLASTYMGDKTSPDGAGLPWRLSFSDLRKRSNNGATRCHCNPFGTITGTS